MSLDKTDIKKIAHLARLGIEDADIPEYVENLTNILNLVEQMNEVDDSNVTPMAHPMDAGQRLREDVITETDQREKFQTIAPSIEDNLYLVPKVIE